MIGLMKSNPDNLDTLQRAVHRARDLVFTDADSARIDLYWEQMTKRERQQFRFLYCYVRNLG